jgi:hypothetical protein
MNILDRKSNIEDMLIRLSGVYDFILYDTVKQDVREGNIKNTLIDIAQAFVDKELDQDTQSIYVWLQEASSPRVHRLIFNARDTSHIGDEDNFGAFLKECGESHLFKQVIYMFSNVDSIVAVWWEFKKEDAWSFVIIAKDYGDIRIIERKVIKVKT